MQVPMMSIKLQWVISVTLWFWVWLISLWNLTKSQKLLMSVPCDLVAEGKEWFSGLPRLQWKLITKNRNWEGLAPDQQQVLCCLGFRGFLCETGPSISGFPVSSQAGVLDAPRERGGRPGCWSHLAGGRLWTLSSDLFLSDSNFNTCGKWVIQSLVNYIFALNTLFTVLSF